MAFVNTPHCLRGLQGHNHFFWACVAAKYAEFTATAPRQMAGAAVST